MCTRNSKLNQPDKELEKDVTAHIGLLTLTWSIRPRQLSASDNQHCTIQQTSPCLPTCHNQFQLPTSPYIPQHRLTKDTKQNKLSLSCMDRSKLFLAFSGWSVLFLALPMRSMLFRALSLLSVLALAFSLLSVLSLDFSLCPILGLAFSLWSVLGLGFSALCSAVFKGCSGWSVLWADTFRRRGCNFSMAHMNFLRCFKYSG